MHAWNIASASLNLPTMPMSASLNLSIIQEQPFASGIYVCVATTPYLKSNVTANITIISKNCKECISKVYNCIY